MRNDLKWLYPDKEVSEEIIKKFAENFKIVYPNDYIQCVKNMEELLSNLHLLM